MSAYGEEPIARSYRALQHPPPKHTTRDLGNMRLMNKVTLIAMASANLMFAVAVCASQPGYMVSWGETVLPPRDESARFASAAGGWVHTIALGTDGTLVAWGGNRSGICIVPNGLSNVIAVAAGNLHNVALRSDGRVFAWGDDTHGQTDLNGITGVVAISASWSHSLALGSDGTVAASGCFLDYLGHPHPETLPSGLSNVVAIAAGQGHSLALKADGTIAAWGLWDPTNVPAGLSGVTAIAAGD